MKIFIFLPLFVLALSGGISSTGDLHMHTTCSDGKATYEQMIGRALELGYDFVVITDHRFDGVGTHWGNGVRTYNDQLCAEVIEQCKNETRLLCIPGQEITGKQHILALGISRGIDETFPVDEIVRQIHSQGGIAIAAHPYAKPWEYERDVLLNSGFDAQEGCREGDTLPCVTDSDAHSVSGIGKHTACKMRISSLEDLRIALENHLCH